MKDEEQTTYLKSTAKKMMLVWKEVETKHSLEVIKRISEMTKGSK